MEGEQSRFLRETKAFGGFDRKLEHRALCWNSPDLERTRRGRRGCSEISLKHTGKCNGLSIDRAVYGFIYEKKVLLSLPNRKDHNENETTGKSILLLTVETFLHSPQHTSNRAVNIESIHGHPMMTM